MSSTSSPHTHSFVLGTAVINTHTTSLFAEGLHTQYDCTEQSAVAQPSPRRRRRCCQRGRTPAASSRPSGKNSDIFHTQKGMKSTHNDMKNYCFSRKLLFHTSKFYNFMDLFHTWSFYFIPWVSFSYLKFLFHTFELLFHNFGIFHTIDIMFIPLSVFSYLQFFILLGCNFIPNYSSSDLLMVFFIP